MDGYICVFVCMNTGHRECRGWRRRQCPVIDRRKEGVSGVSDAFPSNSGTIAFRHRDDSAISMNVEIHRLHQKSYNFRHGFLLINTELQLFLNKKIFIEGYIMFSCLL